MNHDDRLERVRLLSSLLFDGITSAEEKVELNDLLRGDPECCELYLDLAESHAHLTLDHTVDPTVATGLNALPFSSKTRETRSPRSVLANTPWRLLAAAAAVILLANGYALWKDGAEDPEPSHGPGVAVLSRIVDPEWPEGETPPSVGDSVPSGRFSLRSGLAQIEFFSGATVIVEGPAELELESAWRVTCRSGRLRTFVPEPAQGFTIVTPDYEAVDLGTEFALSVGADGRSEVHVLDGEVRLDGSDGRELRHLEAGAAVRSDAGAMTTIEGRGEAFVDRQRLLELARDDWQSRYATWRAKSNELRKDPAALVYFDFEKQDPWDRALANRTGAAPADGAIIGAQWTQGRWPGKGALEFKRINDRLRLRLPGEFQSMTLSTWVRAEGFDRWLNSLFLTDGWEAGEVHWQISDTGQLILGVSGGPNCFSDPVIHPRDLGRWMHLAATIDGSSGMGRIVHYLDGKPVGETVSSKPLPPLRLGDAEIGNWQASDLVNPHPIRSLNGRIDDFFILGRALSPEEIAAIHMAGLPNG